MDTRKMSKRKNSHLLFVLMLAFFMGFLLPLLALARPPPLYPSLQELMGYWKFDDGIGTTAIDSTSTNKHGTIIGATWTDGIAGYGLWFDGDPIDYVNFPILFSSSPSEITVSAWVQASSSPHYEYSDVVYHSANGQFELQMRWDYTHEYYEVFFGVKLQFTAGPSDGWFKASTGEISASEWHHLAGVWTKGESAKLYTNGNLTGEISVPDEYLGDPGGSFPGLIGAYYDGTVHGKGYRGLIDEVRIYREALSGDEIQFLKDYPQPIDITIIKKDKGDFGFGDYQIDYTDWVLYGKIEYFEEEIATAQTSDKEMHARQTVDSDGDIHLVWMSSRLGQWEIYYKEINSSGGTLVSDTLLSETPYDSVFPSVALDSVNDAHIVWIDRRENSGTTWEVYYSKIRDNTGADLTSPNWRVSDADGKDSGRAVQPTNPIDDAVNALFIEHPSIDTDVQNNVHILWSDHRDGNWEIYYQKQTNTGTPTVLIDDLSISPPDGFDSQNPAISAGPDISGDGLPDIHMVWQDNKDENWEVYYQKLSGTNTLVSNETLTIDDNYHSTTPDIAVDNEGYPHIVFMDQRTADPEHAGEDTHLYDLPYWEIFTMALNKTTGDVLSNREGTKRYELRQSDMVGGSWWGNYTGTTLGDSASMYPRIAVSGSWSYGETHITWHDYRSGNWEIYSSSMQNLVNNPQEDLNITDYANSDMYPAIALNTQNKPEIIWQKFDGARWSIFSSSYGGDQYIRIKRDPGTPDEQIYDMFRLDPSDTDSSDGIIYVFRGVFSSEPHAYTFEARNYEYIATPLRTLGGVGGIVVPIDKLGLLVPHIVLTSTIIAATVATAIYTKCVKRRKQEQ